MLVENRFVSLSNKYAYGSIRKAVMQLFNKARGKNSIAYKSSLNDKYVFIADQFLKV